MRSKLYITAGYKNNSTYLKNSFCTHPFKIANVTEDRSARLMKLMIMSSSPGVLDNDHYEVEISVEEEAQLQLTTQSFQRLFTMSSGAEQTMDVHLAQNASFFYIPHPTVPHKSSHFNSASNIYLTGNHNLLWSEIITCGRKLCNEQFTFTRFQNINKVYLNSKLIIKENILLEPYKRSVSTFGQLEGFTHQSSLLYLNNNINIEYLMNECRQILLAIDGIEFGMSALPAAGFAVRMFGYKGEQLFELHRKVASLIEEPIKEMAASINAMG
jgi:urease accessory protein